jgi:hypothetical protein
MLPPRSFQARLMRSWLRFDGSGELAVHVEETLVLGMLGC